MTVRRPLVYVSGPYSADTPEEVQRNVCAAIRTGDAVYACGGLDVVPHLSHYAQQLCPRSYEGWLAVDLELVRRCDIVVRLRGPSPGADREVALAESLGIPVCPLEDILAEIEAWESRQTGMAAASEAAMSSWLASDSSYQTLSAWACGRDAWRAAIEWTRRQQ